MNLLQHNESALFETEFGGGVVGVLFWDFAKILDICIVKLCHNDIFMLRPPSLSVPSSIKPHQSNAH